jgi:chromosome segregation protein
MSTHIKRLVMQGFKSFARKTEIPLEDSMNVIVGPNGSGKSNITDALCFVLGRLSIKSIRAAKAANLLFSGNKTYKGSQEAFVELVFDNKDKAFTLDTPEVSIKRIVRKNGSSVYKINNATKTRQELLELLAQAGIDPNGFNIVLQGEIQSLVKATAEDRRKVLEDVAGISIYETRKEKSLRELEKTDEKIKEVGAVLRERNGYLKNLEKEKQEALLFQKLDETIKRAKKTILALGKSDKEKDLWGVDKLIENANNEIDKLKVEISKRKMGVEELGNKIDEINKKIHDSTSNEKEDLHNEISELRAELAGLEVRKENFEGRIEQNRGKGIGLGRKQEELEVEIGKIQTKSPEIKETQKAQKDLQEKFDSLEEKKRKFYLVKSEIATLENNREQANKFLIESEKEMALIDRSVEGLFNEIKFAKTIDSAQKLKIETREGIDKLRRDMEHLERVVLEKERRNAVLGDEIKREDSLMGSILDLKNCPTCKQGVGEDYKKTIQGDSGGKIRKAKKEEEENTEIKDKAGAKIESLTQELFQMNEVLSEVEIDIMKVKNAEEKKIQIKKITEEQTIAKENLSGINGKLGKLKVEFESLEGTEEDYDEVRVRLQELSFKDLDVDSEISVKQKEINRLNIEKKSLTRDSEGSSVELKKIVVFIDEKKGTLERKEKKEAELFEKFEKLFDEKTELGDKQKAVETDVIGFEHNLRSYEEKINENKIKKAQLQAHIESIEAEMRAYVDVEIFKLNEGEVKERLQKAEFRKSRVGTVNMRAVEIFDKVEEQVRLIKEKVEVIEDEKVKIEKIIGEIDKKKKKAFMVTLEAVNTYFSRNFSQLSRKGTISLELEDKKNPFEGGLNILVKVNRGKYFDITSLSGGEKTMVALSLIFAIQEYRPYCFYIFDEIDAALDKHNSELLAALIKKYMKTGQYLIVTHNDTLISEASNLYGVSMQENISKIISLKV